MSFASLSSLQEKEACFRCVVGSETDGYDRVNLTTSGIKDIESSLYCFKAHPGISCNKKEELDDISVPITGTT